MTAPDVRPGERGQRVSDISDDRLRYIISNAWTSNESAQICKEVLDSRTTIAGLTAEIERLREALATARRDVLKEAAIAVSSTGSVGAAKALSAILALAPAEAEGNADV